MEDITPFLANEINKVFKQEMLKSTKARAVTKAIKSGDINYSQAYKYAQAVGNARAKAFKQVLSSNTLPNGKMYFNIADGIIRNTLPSDHESISEVANIAQSKINKKAKLGIKTQIANVDEDRLKGFIDRIASEDNFDDIAWILDNPVREFCSAVVDSNIKKNAEFQNAIGVSATIERSSNGGCCEYCDNLSGVYSYPGVPGEVFSRHDNCKCTIEYNAKPMRINGHAFTR